MRYNIVSRVNYHLKGANFHYQLVNHLARYYDETFKVIYYNESQFILRRDKWLIIE